MDSNIDYARTHVSETVLVESGSGEEPGGGAPGAARQDAAGEASSPVLSEEQVRLTACAAWYHQSLRQHPLEP